VPENVVLFLLNKIYPEKVAISN